MIIAAVALLNKNRSVGGRDRARHERAHLSLWRLSANRRRNQAAAK
jgi:hypothetical protein